MIQGTIDNCVKKSLLIHYQNDQAETALTRIERCSEIDNLCRISNNNRVISINSLKKS